MPIRIAMTGLLLTAGLLIAAGCQSAPEAAGTEQAEIRSIGETPPDTRMTRQELQQLVLGLSDEYISRVIQAWSYLAEQVETPRDRALVNARAYGTILHLTTVATGESPENALLDLVVYASIEPVIFDRIWADRWGDAAKPIRRQLEEMENETWSVARRLLTPDQEQRLRDMCKAWLEENPGARTAALIRFRDFIAASARKDEPARGLLAEVNRATRSVDEAKRLAERAFWYAQRMPLIVGLQVQSTTYGLADQPEAKQLLEDSRAFSEAATRISVVAEALPDRIQEARVDVMSAVRVEREAAIEQLMDGLTAQRQAVVDDLTIKQDEVSEMLTQLQTTIESGQELVDALNTTVTTVDKVVGRFDRRDQVVDTGREPLDFNLVRDTATETRLALENLVQLVSASETFLQSDAWLQRAEQLELAMQRVERGGNQWIHRVFIDLAILIVVVFVLLLIYRIVARRLAA